MNPLGWARTNWRIVVLVVLLLASVYFLIVPGAPIAGAAADGGNDSVTDGSTNLQFGIDLAGGARIDAPTVGMTAEGVDVTEQNRDDVQREVASSLGIDQADVLTSPNYGDREGFPSEGAVEVRNGSDQAAFAQALRDVGIDADESDVRAGVTEMTRDRVVEVLDQRLGESGFSGGSVTQSRGANEDDPFISVESPNRDLEELRGLIEERGLVEIVAHHPGENGTAVQEPVLRQSGIESISPVERDQDQRPHVPVQVTPDAAESLTQYMQQSGFATQGVQQCSGSLEPSEDEYCLLTRVDGEVVYSSGIAPGLADEFETGEFEQSRTFLVYAEDFGEAQDLRINMIAGELPVQLDLDRGDQFLVNASLAEDFRTNSMLTGLVAVLSVVLFVFLRYGDPRVAAPMSATALSEVVILLGFASAIGWPLQLAHVAGFIAVIGTGVDDLIIIADEVMSQGEVQSHRVFDSRFRKAFWVIGAAAATTIVAMSPLAVLDLGDLRGFAIVTILGVLIGVAVTRPAYGNILRHLKTSGR